MTLATIHRGGEERVLACLPRAASLGSLAFAPLFDEKFPVLPREQWQPLRSEAQIKAFIDASPLPILDQDGEGACGGFSAATAVHACRDSAGEPPVVLAAGRLYHYSGGGFDRGSTLSANLQFAMQLGIPPWTSRRQELDYRSPWSEEEKREAAKYRILAAVDCPSFDLLASAVQVGWAVQHGIDVGRRYEVDASGIWLYDQRGSGGGHAQCTPPGGLCYDGKRWGLLVAGSWGTSFGYRGWYVVPESYFQRSVFTDGWGLRYTVTPQDDPAPPIPSVS